VSSGIAGKVTLHPPYFAGGVARPSSPSSSPPSSSPPLPAATAVAPKAARRRSFGPFGAFALSDSSSSSTSGAGGSHSALLPAAASSPPPTATDPQLGLVLLDAHGHVLLHLVAPSLAARDLWCFGLDAAVKHWRPQTPPAPALAPQRSPPPLLRPHGHGGHGGPPRRSSGGRFSASAGSLDSLDSPAAPLSPISEVEEGATPATPQPTPLLQPAPVAAAAFPAAESNESNGYSPFGLSSDALPEGAPVILNAPAAAPAEVRVGPETDLGDGGSSAASYTGFSASAFGDPPGL
jgi:hypothetical protein